MAGAIRIWDLPTRLVHWGMALLIPFSWWTAENGQMDRHRLSGYLLLGLLLFRLIWGFWGSAPSRFRAFVKGPFSVWRYVRSEGAREIPGHNPLGGWSVVAMLGMLSLQVGLGLFSVDEEGFESGPLSHLLEFNSGRTVAAVHEKLFWLLVALIALHIAAILWYLLIRRKNLVAAMITGRMHPAEPVEQPRIAPAWRAVLAILIAAAAVWFVAGGLSF